MILKLVFFFLYLTTIPHRMWKIERCSLQKIFAWILESLIILKLELVSDILIIFCYCKCFFFVKVTTKLLRFCG